MSSIESFYCVGCDISKPETLMDRTFEGLGICKGCAKSIHTTKEMTFDGKEFTDIVIAPFLYDDVMRDAIRKFKFSGQKLFGKVLTVLALERIKDKNFFEDYDLIIPIPLHRNRLDERDFNQSEIIADVLGDELKKEVATDIIFRIRDTVHQSSLKGLARIKNVKDAFAVFPDSVSGRKIILVDDVYTMGETANECARVLKSAGAEKVALFAICKTVSKRRFM